MTIAQIIHDHWWSAWVLVLIIALLRYRNK